MRLEQHVAQFFIVQNSNVMAELLQVKDTMRSLDIAELTGKRHADIMRDIRNLLEQGVNERNFALVDYADKKGEKRPCYNLTPKGVLILASGYDAVLREKIINRLEELETARRKAERPALPEGPDTDVAEVCKRLYGEEAREKKRSQHTDGEKAEGNLVFVKYGVPVTSTLAIARTFGRYHSEVVKETYNLLENFSELALDIARAYYESFTISKNGVRHSHKNIMLLLTRRAFIYYLACVRSLRLECLQPIIDAFDRAEAEMTKYPANYGGLPQLTTPKSPVRQHDAAATPAQGDMAERMIAAMAVLTGADIKKVQDIMRKGGAL